MGRLVVSVDDMSADKTLAAVRLAIDTPSPAELTKIRDAIQALVDTCIEESSESAHAVVHLTRREAEFLSKMDANYHVDEQDRGFVLSFRRAA
jgi:hypothetical protein